MKKTVFLIFTMVVLIPPCCSFFIGKFADKVQPVLRDLARKYEGILTCIDTARHKADNLDDIPNWDSYYAVLLVNMFSNPSCSLFRTKKDGLFNKKLNKELRSSPPRGPEYKFWHKIGKLMNEAIEIIGPKRVSVLYRGCRNRLDFSGPEFRFETITSTTKTARVADIYSGNPDCETFILIEDAFGADIKKYSQAPYEEEVLLKSTSVFLVMKHTNSTTEIQSEMENILPDMQPKVFVRLRQEPEYRKRQSFFSRLVRCSFGICRN